MQGLMHYSIFIDIFTLASKIRCQKQIRQKTKTLDYLECRVFFFFFFITSIVSFSHGQSCAPIWPNTKLDLLQLKIYRNY